MPNPTFSPFYDPAQSLELQGWEERELSFAGRGVFVKVEGRQTPVGFRSDKFGYDFPITAVWPFWAGVDAKAFLTMLETAYLATDARILVTHGDKLGLEILETSIAESHEWELELRKPSGIIAISFNMTQVG